MALAFHLTILKRNTSLSRTLTLKYSQSKVSEISVAMMKTVIEGTTSDKHFHNENKPKCNSSHNEIMKEGSRFINLFRNSGWKSKNLFQKELEQSSNGFLHIKNVRLNSTSSAAVTKSIGDIKISVQDGLRIITFDRPKKKNAISREMYRDIPLALKEAAEDENTVITVLTGSGDYYTSGNDLTTFAKFASTDIEKAAYDGSILLRDFVSAFIEFPKILVAAVNGPAIGIGVTTLALCDAIYASDKATFHTPFTDLGQSAEGCSTYTFSRIMGTSKASELLYFNKKITAQEAEKWGLVSKVFPDASFEREVFSHLKTLSKLPIKSMMYTKAIARRWDIEDLRNANEAECERLRERWVSEDCLNAVMNFLSKRSKM